MFTDWKRFLVIFALIFVFSGCISYEETIHIFPNGWVRVSVDLKAPSVIFRQLISRSDVGFFRLMTLSRSEAIKKLPSSIQIMEWYLDKSTASWHFHTNFYVKKGAEEQMGKLFAGQKISVKMEDGKVSFKRFLDFTRFGRMIAEMKQSTLVKRELLVGSRFKFTVITPSKIVYTNAKYHKEEKAEWDYKLLDLVSQPQVMEVVFTIPPFAFIYQPLFWLLYGLISMVFYLWLLFKKL